MRRPTRVVFKGWSTSLIAAGPLTNLPLDLTSFIGEQVGDPPRSARVCTRHSAALLVGMARDGAAIRLTSGGATSDEYLWLGIEGSEVKVDDNPANNRRVSRRPSLEVNHHWPSDAGG